MSRIVNRIPYIQTVLTETFPQQPIDAAPASDTEIYISDADHMPIATLETMPKLKLCILESDGYDSLDLHYFEQRKIDLVHAHAVYSMPIAEYIVSKVLDHTTKAPFYRANQETHTYARTDRRLLSAYTIGFLGTGSIACTTAALLKPFGPTIIGYKRSKISALADFDDLYYQDGWKAFLARTDILIAALDLNPSSRSILNAEAFQILKPGCVLINIARGSVVDEAAMRSALQTGRLAAAYLDVFTQEPLPRNHPLWTQPNVFLTPHASALCDENKTAIAHYVVQTVQSYLDQKPLANRVPLQSRADTSRL